MPTIIPVPPSNLGYQDTVETVLVATRAMINDAIASTAGDVLKDDQPFTQTYFQLAYRRFQEKLADKGYSRNKRRSVLHQMPVLGSIDPGSEYWVSWTQCFDGANFWASPTLPTDLIVPIKLAERVSGTNAGFAPMTLWIDGLPSQVKQWRNRVWEWRSDTVFMPGSQMAMDIEIWYLAYMPDIVSVGTTAWTSQPIPFQRALDPLASLMAYEVCNARGDADANIFETRADAGINRMFNRDVKQKQRTNIRRIGRSQRSGRNNDDW